MVSYLPSTLFDKTTMKVETIDGRQTLRGITRDAEYKSASRPLFLYIRYRR